MVPARNSRPSSDVGALVRGPRVRAPELRGRRWINTGGRALSLTRLRGKIVLLDFWTSCCVNCLHALDELRDLERRHADVLVIIGVHSPKFAHEADPDTVDAAVERYGVHHPVLDDPELSMWDAYAARAWPTLAVIDPLGYVVAQVAGEGHAPALAGLVDELIAEHGGRLHRGDGPYVAPAEPSTALRFPGKVISLGATFLVSDTAHHQLVELEDDLRTERRRIGTGVRGLVDGSDARFAEPQGLVLLPAEVAAAVGYDVVVADSGQHALRGVRLADGVVSTVAGPVSTPWDVAWWGGRVVVAAAGTHQLWSFDPRSGELAVLAGTTTEGLRDGAPDEAFFAQPSGLAVGAGSLWVADAESSALRSVEANPAVGAAVTTAVGLGLFEFGHRDGPAEEALLQHPLGVTVLPDGSIAIADTYNGAVRRYDPQARTVSTLARDLGEPSDLLVDGDTLVVVESTARRLVRIPLPASPRGGGGHRVLARTDVAPGPLRLTVAFTPPAGQHRDTRFGEPAQLTVAASPPELLVHGSGTGPGLVRELHVTADGPRDGVLRVGAAAAACDEGDGVFAACHRYEEEWDVPIHVVEDGVAELMLDLRARSRLHARSASVPPRQES